MDNKYKLGIGVMKFIKYFVVLGIVAMVQYFTGNYPQWADVTVGALLLSIANYLKVRWGVRLP